MRALSLIQPWATAIMVGNKLIETRSWKTPYRGRIAIHASKGFPKYAKGFAATERALGRLPSRLPFGAIIGFATLSDIQPTEFLIGKISGLEHMYGNYESGRFGWILTDIEPLPDDKIIPCNGHLGLWEVLIESLIPYKDVSCNTTNGIGVAKRKFEVTLPFKAPTSYYTGYAMADSKQEAIAIVMAAARKQGWTGPVSGGAEVLEVQ